LHSIFGPPPKRLTHKNRPKRSKNSRPVEGVPMLYERIDMRCPMEQ
jgi:hypothetical protein